MSLNAKKEYVAVLKKRYRNARIQEKQAILNSLVAATGYHRRYAMAILKKENPPSEALARRKRIYGDDVKEALVTIWKASNCCCSKRLVPFLPTMIKSLEHHGYLSLDEDLRQKVLAMSPATVDRLLRDERKLRGRKGFSLTKPGNSVRAEIPIRTFGDAVEESAGYLECDLVAHCGGNISGRYIHTLTMTDIATAWTECIPVLYRNEKLVLDAIERGCRQFPFPIKGIDTDNGGEFINQLLLDYCKEKGLNFTRSRPYRKNDQAHVEERNGAVVRALAGYQRFEGPKKLRILNELYWDSRLFYNYFQPCQKILRKTREGSKIRKQYALAKTPHQRLAELNGQPDDQYLIEIDPLKLQLKIKNLQDRLEGKSHASVTLRRTAEPKKRIQIRDRKVKRPHKPKGQPRVFRAVLGELNQILKAEPTLTATPLMKLLNQRFPGSFQHQQMETLSREIWRWRRENPEFVKG